MRLRVQHALTLAPNDCVDATVKSCTAFRRTYVEVDPVCDCGVDILLPLDFPCFCFQRRALCGRGGPRQRSRQCRRRSREHRQETVSPRVRRQAGMWGMLGAAAHSANETASATLLFVAAHDFSGHAAHTIWLQNAPDDGLGAVRCIIAMASEVRTLACALAPLHAYAWACKRSSQR